MNANRSNQRQLTHDGNNYRPAVSPDGRCIVFNSTRSGKSNIWRIDADGDNPKQLTNGKSNSYSHISPDGRWVVFASWDHDTATLWKTPVDGGDRIRLTETTSTMPAVSPDGKLIASFYFDDQANPPVGVMILPFDGRVPIKRLNIIPDVVGGAFHWSADGLALMYIDAYLSNIWSQPVDGGKSTRLTDFQGEQIFYFDWSPDGKSLALARGRMTDDIVLISDFK